MRLLIKRDPTSLTKTDGKAILDSDAPDFLKTPRVVSQSQVRYLHQRSPDDDLLLANSEDYKEIDEHFKTQVSFLQKIGISLKNITFPGIWSGYRSVIVQDPKTKKLYRFKGVSLNPEKPEITEFENGNFRVQGGQLSQNSEYERKMSNKFNKVLLNQGIQPIMKFRGLWKYPQKAKRCGLVASIFEVEGDTRLDELMLIIETLALFKDFPGLRSPTKAYLKSAIEQLKTAKTTTPAGNKFFKAISEFYFDLGFVTGRLKKLMDKSGQTWSCDSETTNAHTGNIVVYNGTDKVKLGFVDFDASYDYSELTWREARELKEREYNMIRASAMRPPISPREIGFYSSKNHFIIFQNLREQVIKGFEQGYESREKNISNEIDIGKIQEIFSLLRSEEGFIALSKAAASTEYYTKHDIFDYDFKDKFKYKTRSLDSIIKQSYGYEKNIKEYKINSCLDKKDSYYFDKYDPYGIYKKDKLYNY